MEEKKVRYGKSVPSDFVLGLFPCLLLSKSMSQLHVRCVLQVDDAPPQLMHHNGNETVYSAIVM